MSTCGRLNTATGLSLPGPVPALEKGLLGANAGRDASLGTKHFRIFVMCQLVGQAQR